MEKEEYIAYIYLRAEECGYKKERLDAIKAELLRGDMKLYDRLHRISEPEFRKWISSVSK